MLGKTRGLKINTTFHDTNITPTTLAAASAAGT
jgi:hypothetical protein